jgi:glycosyltransferase involved in cell wall biosynthesis
VEREGVDADRVAVASPGILLSEQSLRASLGAPEEIGLRILMVSRDFYTKGGDVVVDALRVIRADHDPRAILTVLGPSRWPLAGDPPEGVDFVGAVPRERVPAYLAGAHVFAMPSRLEGFGMALVEALASGVPCVARRAYAMPEIVEDGVDGVLVDELSAGAVAAALVRVGLDRAMRERTEQRAASVRETRTWDRTATITLDAISRWTRQEPH